MIDVFAMMRYWVSWPPHHKLYTAKAGYKAPRSARRKRVGERSPVERGVDLGLAAKPNSQIALAPGMPASRVLPFSKLPNYVQDALKKENVNAGTVTNRDNS